MGHVGLVLCFQINRLTREDEALCRLIKVCAAFDTLLADQDGLYHPLDFNDRLLLTVKGLMGGIELHEIQQRMQAGRLNRARRGEWLGQAPPGFVIGPDSKLQFDPDEQVQSVTHLILEQFARLGSISGLLRYPLQHHIADPLPRAQRGEPGTVAVASTASGDAAAVSCVVRPMRAPTPGADGPTIRGGRPGPPRPGSGGTANRTIVPCSCQIIIPLTSHGINIRAIFSCLRRQRPRRGPVPGPARQTVALLAGLVVCGPCGCRMQTHYTRTLRYDCQRHALDYGRPACQSLVGEPLEQLVAEQILEVVTPAGLELSLRATAECERERATLDRQWQLRLERAAHDTAVRIRQYDAVEPENRLVARTLERKWEEALLAQRALEEEYHRFRQSATVQLTAAECAEIAALSGNLPTIWHAPQTGVAEKRRIVRLLLERVVVFSARVQEVTVHLHWTGDRDRTSGEAAGAVLGSRSPVLRWCRRVGAGRLRVGRPAASPLS